MNERVQRLRQLSLEEKPSISAERALLLTRFYKDNEAKYSVPVLRAAFCSLMNFAAGCSIDSRFSQSVFVS